MARIERIKDLAPQRNMPTVSMGVGALVTWAVVAADWPWYSKLILLVIFIIAVGYFGVQAYFTDEKNEHKDISYADPSRFPEASTPPDSTPPGH